MHGTGSRVHGLTYVGDMWPTQWGPKWAWTHTGPIISVGPIRDAIHDQVVQDTLLEEVQLFFQNCINYEILL